MGGGQVPDESQLETRMWFYYQAASYIDIGCEASPSGHGESMNRRDKDNAHWEELLTWSVNMRRSTRAVTWCLQRPHAHRRLAAGWQPLAGLQCVPVAHHGEHECTMEAVLKVGYSDGLYGRSKGGKTFSGWSCEHLPYWWNSITSAPAGIRDSPAAPRKALRLGLRRNHLVCAPVQGVSRQVAQYAWDWLRDTDTNAHLQMPGSRTATSSDTRWYFANNKSDAVPNGSGDEAAIRAVWANDTARLNK
jgi:hypothetical protein